MRHADVERARELLRERHDEARSLDWEEVDVGEREDTLPLRPVESVPWLAKVGFALAAAILILSALFAIVAVLL